MSEQAGKSSGSAGAPIAGMTAEELRSKKIFTTGEAAQVCKVSQQTIIRCFDAGRLQGFRVPGSKFRRIPREELIRFMQHNGIPTEPLESGPKRVLVVDDDPGILELFEDFLGQDARFEVRTCSTGYDAGLLTESFKPNLVVLDYMLPDINGNVVCERMRARDDLKDTRVLFVSGVVNRSEIEHLLSVGGNEFVQKPFDIAELTQRMVRLLEIDAKTGA